MAVIGHCPPVTRPTRNSVAAAWMPNRVMRIRLGGQRRLCGVNPSCHGAECRTGRWRLGVGARVLSGRSMGASRSYRETASDVEPPGPAPRFRRTGDNCQAAGPHRGAVSYTDRTARPSGPEALGAAPAHCYSAPGVAHTVQFIPATAIWRRGRATLYRTRTEVTLAWRGRVPARGVGPQPGRAGCALLSVPQRAAESGQYR